MGLVSTWLNGIGLSRQVATFQAAGIVTPAALAELEVQHFEALGISDSDDRRKLFYLVQRIKMAVNKDKQHDNSVEDQVDAVISGSISKSLDETPETLEDEKKTETIAEETGARRRSKRLASSKKQESAPNNAKENRLTNGFAKATKVRVKVVNPNRRSHIPINKDTDAAEEEFKTEKEVPSRPSTTLHNKRPTEQNVATTATAVFNLEGEDESSATTTSTSSSSFKRRVSESTTRRKSGLKTPIIAAVVSNLSDNESTSGEATGELKPVKTPTSKQIQAPKPRRESRLQNPGKSIRTGKSLSTIPSESIAPMSPLVHLPQSKLEESTGTTQPKTNKPRQSQSHLQKEESSGSSLDDLLQSSVSETESFGNFLETESDNESLTQIPTLKNNRPKSMGGAGSGLSQGKIPGPSRIARPSQKKPKNGGDLNASFDSSLNSSGRRSFHRVNSHNSVKSSGSTSSTTFVQGGAVSESFATKIAYLREDNNEEHELFRDQADQQIYDYDMSIRVIVRKRPVSKSEEKLSGGIDVIHPLDYGDFGRTLIYHPKTRVDLTKEIETIPFAFDNVFDESSTNVQIYERSLRNLIKPFFKGQWATVFAYGQTGSGKTYTMMGSNMTGINAGTSDESNFGLYYLAALDIFEMLKRPEYSHLSVQVSLFEIYGGKLFDLLNGRKQVKCLEDSKGKVCFPGLTEHAAQGPDRLMELIEEGAQNRSTGTTSRNADSSRSHAVLQLNLRKDVGRRKNVEHGRFNFIDLAGSERGADTSSCSRATRLEGAEINTSLLALKEVIRALATGGSMTRIPFRGSKLTQVLKDSFVGKNSRCCMVACISPDIGNCEQTLNTLRYADRVKERHSESGALPSSCEQPIRLCPIQFSGQSEEGSPSTYDTISESIGQSSSREEDEEAEEEEDASVTKIYESADTDAAVLDDLLSTPLHNPQEFVSEPASPMTPIVFSAKHKAGETLVTGHRSVMTSMLAMVKKEMILVNTVDADRDGLDNYLAELQRIQTTQLELISKLRTSLNNYVSAVENPLSSSGDVVSDDESFEDLRD